MAIRTLVSTARAPYPHLWSALPEFDSLDRISIAIDSEDSFTATVAETNDMWVVSSSRLRHTAAPAEPVTPVTVPLHQCYTPEIAGQLGFVYGVTVNL